MGVELANHTQYSLMEEETEDYGVSDSELVDHVRAALKSVALGDSDNYNQLVGVMHHSINLTLDEVALLKTSLDAISGAAGCLDCTHHASLLSSIFSMSMWNYGPEVMDSLTQLLISLAASSGKYVDSCLEMLVCNFMPPISFLEILKQPRGLTKKEQVTERVHSALKSISVLVPLAPVRLVPIIRQRMPDFRKKEPLLVSYVENILKLENSALGPLIGNRMLIMGVVDRLIELDCEIGWDEILSDEPTKGIFEIELEEEEALVDFDDDGAEGQRDISFLFKSLAGNVVADKLDSLMVLTFEHIKLCDDNGRLAEVFDSLLQAFQSSILNAYKSKFAQFVMFYACSLDPEDSGVRFAQFLADLFISSNSPLLTRMSAVAYLASYMARASFLRTTVITTILERLVHWCSEYVHSRSGYIDPTNHRIFYAGCQAIMYVLCFRMRSILETPRLKSQLLQMPLGVVLKNSMDPLKVCLPSIVDEFVRQAKTIHLLDGTSSFAFSDVLESELSRAYGGIERLDMFFPFDPCLLKKCDSYIRPIFIYWSMVRTLYDDEEEDGSEADFSDNEADPHREGSPEVPMAESFEEHYYQEDFNDSLSKMSITPRDTVSHMNLLGAQKSEQGMQMPSRIRPSMSP